MDLGFTGVDGDGGEGNYAVLVGEPVSVVSEGARYVRVVLKSVERTSFIGAEGRPILSEMTFEYIYQLEGGELRFVSKRLIDGAITR